jgi:DNA-binding MarR family transcriptional regulator
MKPADMLMHSPTPPGASKAAFTTATTAAKTSTKTPTARSPAMLTPPLGCTHFKLRQLLRSVSKLYDAEIAHAGLKGSQFSLLAHVLSLGPISPSDLATQMGMDASTLTRNLRPLTAKGWVLQGPGADHRGRSIAITAAGLVKHAQARPHWKRAQQLLNQRLGEPEVAALHRLMAHAQAALTDRLGDRLADPAAEPAADTDPAEA